MKKGLFFAAALFVTGTVSAQGLYVGVNAGYGFSGPGDMLGTSAVETTGSTTETPIYGTLGGGINAGLNLGYMFNEHIGADLGVNYFMGSMTRTSDYSAPDGSSMTRDSKSSQMRLAPSLVLSTGGDFSAYTRFGLVLPVGGSTITEVRDNTSGTAVEIDVESKGAPSLGFNGAFGVDFAFSDKLSFFGELSAVNLRIKSSSSSITKYTVGGQDVMGTMTTYEKETVFVDELNNASNNFNYNSNASTGSAREELASKTNFNGVFIGVGLKYRFN